MKKQKINPGAVIDEPGNSVNSKRGGFKTYKPIVDPKKCIKCGKCWMFCPDIAIKFDGKSVPVHEYEFCKGCGICAKVCPVNAIRMELVQ